VSRAKLLRRRRRRRRRRRQVATDVTITRLIIAIHRRLEEMSLVYMLP
jgi:hypothetical protein